MGSMRSAMEARGILQMIGMEAAVLVFLFTMAYAAIRISVAERNAQKQSDKALIPINTEKPIF